jgi:hypothetical protein
VPLPRFSTAGKLIFTAYKPLIPLILERVEGEKGRRTLTPSEIIKAEQAHSISDVCRKSEAVEVCKVLGRDV